MESFAFISGILIVFTYLHSMNMGDSDTYMVPEYEVLAIWCWDYTRTCLMGKHTTLAATIHQLKLTQPEEQHLHSLPMPIPLILH